MIWKEKYNSLRIDIKVFPIIWTETSFKLNIWPQYIIEDYKVKHRSPFPAWGEQLSEYGCYASTGELLVQILLGSLLGFETQAIYKAPGGF